MKSFNQIGVAMLAAVMMSACASHPEQVPDYKPMTYQEFPFKDLKPRALEIRVENLRAINKTANNSLQVEQAVAEAFVNAFEKCGVSVVSRSQNKLTITLEDCKDAPEGAACVQMNAKFRSPRVAIEVGGFARNGYTREGRAWQSFGDISEAYRTSTGLIMEGLNQQFEKLSMGR